MEDFPKQVVDERGAIHRLTEKIGEGGQGAVFRTEDGRMAAKLTLTGSPAQHRRLQHQLKRVRLLPLSELPIARPLEILRPPYLGYVMELLTGMTSLAELMIKPQDRPSLAEWYRGGGGLSRRLRLLARAAEALARLHAYSLVYADPSPNNIFVSQARDAHEVWLIDADNLHFQSKAGSPTVYTPGYGAPELVEGRSGVNTLTDAHAFAVIAFLALAQVHPLLGDWVSDGEPELEEQALAGKLPWIDHPEDDRNRSSCGFPREMVLTRHLQQLCHECFGTGLTEPSQRPGLSKWVGLLHEAADWALPCHDCGSTFYPRMDMCPWCDHPRQRFVLITLRRWEPTLHGTKGGGSDIVRARLTMTHDSPLRLTARTTEALTGPDQHLNLVELSRLERGIRITLLEEAEYWVSSGDGIEPRPIHESVVIPSPETDSTWRLHFGPLDRPHRVAMFEDFPGVTP